MTDKKILDACCGSRMFWFDKNNPLVLFNDIRKEDHVLCDGRKLVINPDIVSDFRNMPFDDEAFKLVVFDPPHLKNLGKSSYMAKKYGVLGFTWEMDILEGFKECMRVLEPNGLLIFKWNESQIKVNDLLSILPQKPLFGHPTSKNGHTIWMTFYKNL
ncbi:class I SAM-dependent methyltransferase [Arachidicoccus terrestris]|uniref:class I SAM-dependent methyltransferase n=1 Tax=Arachidicoccus terrestris TaxID=2875539 RepID=UPI001CC35893|nr:class I SAM-dependent methyltransferase [Arachidicoccus terrestris]UAY56243.1 class I SAM-dependent methyltransferase [Arachidicoccus terrestris]